MRISVLGPMRAWLPEHEIALGSPQQRAVLALLLLNSGRAVGIRELVDGVWGDRPPSAAVSVVRTYVSRLRKLLEPDRAAGEPSRLVESRGDGYLVRTGAFASDLADFEEAVARAGRSRAAGDHEATARLLDAALSAWEGLPLAGVPGPHAEAERERLEEERLKTLEARFRADLELGRHASVVADLRALSEAHPMREPVSELLITALHRCGRRAEALEVYTRTRRILNGELGVEPGPSLQAARAHLHADADADEHTLAPPGAVPAGTGPAQHPDPAPDDAAGTWRTCAERGLQLPSYPDRFAGRATELARLSALLLGDGPPGAPVVGIVHGMAGVGKTALAVHWAHRVADRFPDGARYVNLRGDDESGTAMEPAAAAGILLIALGVAPHAVPDGLDDRTALLRSVLVGRRVLMVLDNARDAEQVRPLLPGTPGCLAVVTSRSRLRGLVVGHGAVPMRLDPPTADDARAILTRRLHGVRLDPGAVDEIVSRCARLPLALAVVAARAKLRPGFRASDIVAELRASHGSLDAFAAGDAHMDARAVFSWSYRGLSSGAATLFRRLSLHPGPHVTAAAAGSLLGTDGRPARALLAELTGANMIVEHRAGSFTQHELLRSYGVELAESEDTEDDRTCALRRLYDHYLGSVRNAFLALDPFASVAPVDARPTEGTGHRFGDAGAAAEWLRAERHVLGAVVEHACDHGFHDHAWRMAAGMEPHLARLGHWYDVEKVSHAALRAATAAADLTGQAHAHHAVGHSQSRSGQRGEALYHLRLAVELFDATGDAQGQALAHRGLAGLALAAGDYARAIDHYAHAHALYTRTARRSGQGRVLGETAWAYLLSGRYAHALERCTTAVALLREIGDTAGEAVAHDVLGAVLHCLGRYDEALEHYTVALRQHQDGTWPKAETLCHLGDTRRAQGDAEGARTAWRAALCMLEHTDRPEAAEVLRTRMRDADAGV